MNNAKRRITITDNSQAIENGVTTPVTPDQIKSFLRDPTIETKISNVGLYSIGWKDRNGTPETFPVASPAKPAVSVPSTPEPAKKTPNPITPTTPKVDKSSTHNIIPSFNAWR